MPDHGPGEVPAHGGTLYDRLVRAAEAQMFTHRPAPQLAVAARSAGVPLTVARTMFADNAALSRAVTEQSMIRLTDHLIRCTTSAAADDPVAQYKALSTGFIEWALVNPVSVGVLTQRRLSSPSDDNQVQRYGSAIHDLARNLLERANTAGMLAEGVTVDGTLFHGRALTLGLVRLAISVNPVGQPAEATTIAQACAASLAQFYAGMFRAEASPPMSGDQPIRSEA